jgi:hypothetical protein
MHLLERLNLTHKKEALMIEVNPTKRAARKKDRDADIEKLTGRIADRDATIKRLKAELAAAKRENRTPVRAEAGSKPRRARAARDDQAYRSELEGHGQLRFDGFDAASGTPEGNRHV